MECLNHRLQVFGSLPRDFGQRIDAANQWEASSVPGHPAQDIATAAPLFSCPNPGCLETTFYAYRSEFGSAPRPKRIVVNHESG